MRSASSSKTAEGVDAALLGILRKLNLVTPDLLTRIAQEEATAQTFANGDLSSLTQIFHLTSGRAEQIQRAARDADRDAEHKHDRPPEVLAETKRPEASRAASNQRPARAGSEPAWVASRNQRLHFVIEDTKTPMRRGKDSKPLDRIFGTGAGLQQVANMKLQTCDRCFAMLPGEMQSTFALMPGP